MSDGMKVGLVNFVTNNPYGSIHRFCPSVDFMDRLKSGRLVSYPYYSENKNHENERQEFNNAKYELLSYTDYFKENYNLTIIGYINQACNFYIVSKFLNNGLTFIVLNMPTGMNLSTITNDVGKYLKIIKKNAPDSAVAVILRYAETNKWCLLANSAAEIKKSVSEKYPKLVNVLIHKFSYTADFDIISSTFVEIQDVIKKHYKDENKFVSWTPDEEESLRTLFHDKILSKKSVFTENTIRSVCNASHMDADLFMKKLVKSGTFSHFTGDPIDKYYFKNGLSNDRIMPVLMSLLGETTYLKKTSGFRLGLHYVSSSRFRGLIPDLFKKKIMMSDRLILKIIESLKIGRATLKGNRLYLRKYDFDELDSTFVNCRENIRFIYD